MAELRHTVMSEDMSLVNARAYGATRDTATILAALTVIGSRVCTLVLIDEDDGVWTLTTDLSIPANVVLQLPAGVRLLGTGNLTILGGLMALRTDWFQSTGVLTWSASALPLVGGALLTYRLHLGTEPGETVTLQRAPATTTWVLTLPPTPGTTGQVLLTDGAGVTTWGAVVPSDATLQGLAGLTPDVDNYIYFTGPDVPALGLISTLGRTWLTHVAPSQMRSTMQLGALAIKSVIVTADITDKQVTYAKIQDVTLARLLGRYGAGIGPPQEITLGVGLALSGVGVLSVTGSAYQDSPTFLLMGA